MFLRGPCSTKVHTRYIHQYAQKNSGHDTELTNICSERLRYCWSLKIFTGGLAFTMRLWFQTSGENLKRVNTFCQLWQWMDLGTGNLDGGGWYRWNGGSRWQIKMKWWIRIGMGVVDMDEVRLAHMDRDRVRLRVGDMAYFWKRDISYKGRERFRNEGYYTPYQPWLQ